MTSNQTTKARYFILGLMICLLSSHYLFQMAVPAEVKRSQLWIDVHTAITGSSYVALVIGALGGFALSRKVLSPIPTLLVSVFMGYSIIGLHMTEFASTLELGAIVVLPFIAGFLGCWASVEFFGKNSEPPSD